mmetsp:Transcript_15175/g.49378  ORF Transcript_15175/g.49378 Transcript_15175/m.49378 type:complete len:201 (+) Transcript_15175:195-797(+)
MKVPVVVRPSFLPSWLAPAVVVVVRSCGQSVGRPRAGAARKSARSGRAWRRSAAVLAQRSRSAAGGTTSSLRVSVMMSRRTPPQSRHRARSRGAVTLAPRARTSRADSLPSRHARRAASTSSGSSASGSASGGTGRRCRASAALRRASRRCWSSVAAAGRTWRSVCCVFFSPLKAASQSTEGKSFSRISSKVLDSDDDDE